MTRARPLFPLAALVLATLLPAGCASTGGGDAIAGVPEIPPDAVESTRTESNGDVVTEYRVGGTLSMVRIDPINGPVYYLTDADGDGRMDRRGDGTPSPVYFKLYGW